MNRLFIKNKQKGFTLIEVLIASFVFLLIVGAVVSLLISTIEAQVLVLKDQKSVSEVSYAMEYMSRALRMAKTDGTGTCLGSVGYNYLNVNGVPSTIRFLSYDNRCQEFGLSGRKIYEKKSTDNNSGNFQSEVYITSSNVDVNPLIFDAAGSGWTGGINQPKVMINMKAGPKDEGILMNFQTTASKRY